MISVIVPTMWRYKPFLNFLKYLVQIPCISEIIIVNNDVKETPADSILSHEKIRFHNSEQNLFVNPSWNLGANIAKEENLCFLSDDVICDLKVFLKANEFMNTPDTNMGILGAIPGVEPNQIPFVDGSIDILSQEEMLNKGWGNGYGFGSLFFVHKRNWVEIPDVLKIWFGDTYQLDMQSRLGRKNYMFGNVFFHSPWSVTAKTILYDNKEEEIFWRKFREI